MYVFTTSKGMLIDSLVYENGTPLSYSLNLELLYQVALQLKQKTDVQLAEIEKEPEETNASLQSDTSKNKKLNF